MYLTFLINNKYLIMNITNNLYINYIQINKYRYEYFNYDYVLEIKNKYIYENIKNEFDIYHIKNELYDKRLIKYVLFYLNQEKMDYIIENHKLLYNYHKIYFLFNKYNLSIKDYLIKAKLKRLFNKYLLKLPLLELEPYEYQKTN